MNYCANILRMVKCSRIKITCAFSAMILIVALWSSLGIAVFAFSQISPLVLHTSIQQENSQGVIPSTPIRTYAQQFVVPAGHSRVMGVSEFIVSAVSVDTNIATVEIKDNHSLFISGLKPGTTILIISFKNSWMIYAINVERPQVVRQSSYLERNAVQSETSLGSSRLYFTAGFKGAPSLLRHTFEYSQKLRNSRTLHVGGELFHFFGGGDAALTLPLAVRFGANRLKLAFDSPTTKLDLLDSELEISPLGFNSYTLRGPHFFSSPESRWRGLELFAGTARPQLTLFNQGEGYLAGGLIPIIQGGSLHVRTGMFFIAPAHGRGALIRSGSGGERRVGIVSLSDVRYSPNDRTNIEGEVAYANGGISWRARVELQRGPIKFFGERLRLNERSPMILIGAQPAGRNKSAFNIHWRVSSQFGTAVSYSRTTNRPWLTTQHLELNNRTVSISASFTPTKNTRFGYSFNQQLIDSPAATLGPFLFNLQTRSVVMQYDQRLNQHWTNNVDTRIILNRETNTETKMNRGMSLREQIRFNWRRGSIAGFFNYRSNTPSLESLILRNPALLPKQLRDAFTLDPRRFFLTNRDELPYLLSGVDLPVTRNREGGVRLQAALARVGFAGELVYSLDKYFVSDQRAMRTTFSAKIRLDTANDVDISASRIFALHGNYNQSAVGFGYTHRFGSAASGGFQFSRLFGFSRGRIRGRVFIDSNGNGQEDSGEPGLTGIKIQLEGARSVTTDSRGDFNFDSLPAGEFAIALVSEELGVTLRASKPIPQQLSLSPRQTITLSLGLTNRGFIAGRIFNDLSLKGEPLAGDSPGVGSVKILLHPTRTEHGTPEEQSLTQIVNSSGQYEFRNLTPGSYTIELDPKSLPPNYQLPDNNSWSVTIAPLQGTYFDIPLVAYRAISGVVFMDRDGDKKFDPKKDEVVANATIVAGPCHATTDSGGAYMLRNLPAGRVEIRTTVSGQSNEPVTIILGPEPIIRQSVNLRISR